MIKPLIFKRLLVLIIKTAFRKSAMWLMTSLYVRPIPAGNLTHTEIRLQYGT